MQALDASSTCKYQKVRLLKHPEFGVISGLTHTHTLGLDSASEIATKNVHIPGREVKIRSGPCASSFVVCICLHAPATGHDKP